MTGPTLALSLSRGLRPLLAVQEDMDRVMRILLIAAVGTAAMLGLHCVLHPDCAHTDKH